MYKPRSPGMNPIVAEEVTAWLHIHECVVNSGILFRIWRSKFLFGYKTVGSRNK